MKSVATIKIKIPNNKLILETMIQYSKAVSYIADEGFKINIINRYKLHHLYYYKARELFALPSQFIINANRVASQTLKSVSSNKGSKPVFKEFMPLAFDRRTFTFSFDKIRITTIKGRIDIPISIPEYYWKYLDWNYQTALIVKDKQRLFLHITFSRQINSNITSRSNGKIIGVDLGINNLAVTSEGVIFKTPKTRLIQFHYLRKRLQCKGTKSAKRLLKRLSGRQKRFMRHYNHIISKDIISKADIIVMENLKGIRKISKGRRFNRWLNSWSFYQLQSFIRYKAEREGKTIQFVKPYMTSQTCSSCGGIGSRYFDYFSCHCGFSSLADLNASFNLRRMNVTHPNISSDDAKSSIGELRQSLGIKFQKPHALA